MRRPVTSVSDNTAALESGSTNPALIGATTTAAPADPGASGTTGACTPCSASTSESRVAPGAVAAQRVTR